MSDGLITRIGKWIDRKWESSATESEMLAIAFKHDARMDKLAELIAEVATEARGYTQRSMEEFRVMLKAVNSNCEGLAVRINALPPEGVTQALSKDVSDLVTRMERIELYSGMVRKIDPSKPPVVKSAFSM
jgi:hypothetical protein